MSPGPDGHVERAACRAMSAVPSGSETGYRHPAYAASFTGAVTPRELPHCGGWYLERPIPGTDLRDGMGCYPIFACRDWRGLARDLPALASRLVSLSLVTDPFGAFTESDLRQSFQVVRPYKTHYVVDLDQPTDRHLAPASHRRNTARALRSVQTDICVDPLAMLDEWTQLYAHLVARHRLTGARVLPRASLTAQLMVPGMTMFKAVCDGEVVGLHLWYVMGDTAYGHLGATSRKGYELMASYALYARAIESFRGRLRGLNLGSSAGLPDDESGRGLRAFKAGWSTGTRPAYLCGRVFQHEPYARLAAAADADETSCFPAYRRAEFEPPASRHSSADDRPLSGGGNV
jgi:hypothetical protein